MVYSPWFSFALSAAPSIWLWSKAAYVWGAEAATYAAVIMQAIGVILPVMIPNVLCALIGSILFGGTFMGITTLSLSIGRQCAPERGSKIIGNMTAMFSIGQIIGPIGGGALAAVQHSYSTALLLSGGLLVVAVVMLWFSNTRSQK